MNNARPDRNNDHDPILPFAELLDPNDGSRHDWLMPLLLYLEHSLLNDGSRSSQGRLGDSLSPALLANVWELSAERNTEFDALCPWTDLRESEWKRLAGLLGDATEGAAIAGWQAVLGVYREALLTFERDVPSVARRDLSSIDVE